MAKRYGVSSAPVVLAFRSGSKKPEKYTGAISYRDLHDWTNIRAETFVKGGGFSVTDTKEEMPKPWCENNVCSFFLSVVLLFFCLVPSVGCPKIFLRCLAHLIKIFVLECVYSSIVFKQCAYVVSQTSFFFI